MKPASKEHPWLWVITALTVVPPLPGPVLANTGEPGDTVIAFYQHIAKHECEAAARLAEGYSVERCEAIRFLKPPSMIKLVVSSSTQPDQVHVSYRVEYSRNNDAGERHCDEVKTLKLVRRDRWIIDWNRVMTKSCQPSATEPVSPSTAGEPGPSSSGTPDKIEISEVHSTPPLATSVLHPTTNESLPTLSGAIAPIEISEFRGAKPMAGPKAGMPSPANPTDPAALLQTWSPEELQGRAGDERIIPVRPPDISPPLELEPKGKLPKVEGSLANSIRRVRLPEGKNLVALTFDLCEQADDRTGYDRRIVNFLRERRIPATFFAGGKWLRSHEDKALQLMADPNFEIGNHGWTHGNLRVLRGRDLLNQIVWTQAEYSRLRDILDRRAEAFGLAPRMVAIPLQPLTLRFPYGTCDAESLKAANELGLRAIQWDVVSGDAVPRTTPEALTRAVLAGVRPGSIVVFHANGRGHGTAEALPRIVAALETKGFGFATVGGLLREGVPESVAQCYEMRPGDNLYIDAKFGDGTGAR